MFKVPCCLSSETYLRRHDLVAKMASQEIRRFLKCDVFKSSFANWREIRNNWRKLMNNLNQVGSSWDRAQDRDEFIDFCFHVRQELLRQTKQRKALTRLCDVVTEPLTKFPNICPKSAAALMKASERNEALCDVLDDFKGNFETLLRSLLIFRDVFSSTRRTTETKERPNHFSPYEPAIRFFQKLKDTGERKDTEYVPYEKIDNSMKKIVNFIHPFQAVGCTCFRCYEFQKFGEFKTKEALLEHRKSALEHCNFDVKRYFEDDVYMCNAGIIWTYDDRFEISPGSESLPVLLQYNGLKIGMSIPIQTLAHTFGHTQ